METFRNYCIVTYIGKIIILKFQILMQINKKVILASSYFSLTEIMEKIIIYMFVLFNKDKIVTLY
jgi:hypothetical protein